MSQGRKSAKSRDETAVRRRLAPLWRRWTIRRRTTGVSCVLYRVPSLYIHVVTVVYSETLSINTISQTIHHLLLLNQSINKIFNVRSETESQPAYCTISATKKYRKISKNRKLSITKIRQFQMIRSVARFLCNSWATCTGNRGIGLRVRSRVTDESLGDSLHCIDVPSTIFVLCHT